MLLRRVGPFTGDAIIYCCHGRAPALSLASWDPCQIRNPFAMAWKVLLSTRCTADTCWYAKIGQTGVPCDTCSASLRTTAPPCFSQPLPGSRLHVGCKEGIECDGTKPETAEHEDVKAAVWARDVRNVWDGGWRWAICWPWVRFASPAWLVWPDPKSWQTRSASSVERGAMPRVVANRVAAVPRIGLQRLAAAEFPPVVAK